MLSASAAGASVAGFLRPNTGNVMGSVLTFYLVATGWAAARRSDGKSRIFDLVALLFALAIGAAGVTWGFEAANSQTGSKDGYAPAFYFIFGSIALLFASSDVRLILRGGVFGAKRIARHLLRMCMALLFAGLSFYPGQAKFFPKWLNQTNLLYVPHVLLIGAMLFWLYRVSVRRRVPQVTVRTKEKTMKLTVNAPPRTQALLRVLLICLLAPAAVAMADGNPISAHTKGVYGGLKKILLRAAEKVPQEDYNFKPTEAVRSYGQIIGHLADSQYNFCSVALGEKAPALNIEKTKTSKADLIAALKDSFTYCDKAYDGMTDASGSQMVKFMGGDTPKLGVLMINGMHSTEHYGNLVTYMRLKNIVPPTSDPEFMKQLMK
jgi:uncharacterized damage-inducible protein DinB